MSIHFLKCFRLKNGGGILLKVAKECKRMAYDMQEIDRKKVGKVGILQK